ncbi:AGE family epimerase/isomerase [Balneolaceae bacterium ANBcel3]|nr:AGE family epimerase/isomerase [Balneolaceae bacterium ANBcel3]
MKQIVFVVIFCVVNSACSKAKQGFNAEIHQDVLENIYEEAVTNGRAVYSFWEQYSAVNFAEYGFYGDITIDGTVEKGQRNSIQQGRQLFTVATWYRVGVQSETAALIAYNQFRYLIEAFHDPENKEFYIDDVDKPNKSPNRRLYNNSFAIYGLTHYYLAFHDHPNETYREAAHEALAIAIECFKAMDQRAHDADYLGYQQIPVNGLADNEMRLDGGDKEANTHIHIMEALTSLYEAWLLRNNSVRDILPPEAYAYAEENLLPRLDEILVDVVAGRFCVEDGERAYCRTEFTRDWTLVNDRFFSFAHDIETAWLFMEALRVMGTEVSNREAVVSMAKKLIHTVFEHGLIQEDNGYASIALGRIPDYSVYSDNKDWWQHFEAIAGLYYGARIVESEELQARYLNRILDLFTYLDEGGLKVVLDEGVWEYRWHNRLANEWKAGYHTVRALLFVKEWIEEDLPVMSTRTGYDNEKNQPVQWSLGQNYPNPFNPSTRIPYTLKDAANVTLEIYDVTGRKVRSYGQGYQNPGKHTLEFSAHKLPTGIYVYMISAGTFSKSRIMTFLR